MTVQPCAFEAVYIIAVKNFVFGLNRQHVTEMKQELKAYGCLSAGGTGVYLLH